MTQIKVLVCDDSALMRRSLKKIIESDPRLIVAGTARDGQDSVNKARELQPDVITMDVHMPGMDGITALQIIQNEQIAPVIMISYYTQEGAEVTFEAMALGAFDYVPKFDGTISDLGPVKLEIIEKIKAAAKPGMLQKLSRNRLARNQESREQQSTLTKKRPGSTGYKAVVMGISTGGPKTLFDVLPYLPGSLPVPVFLVQHMPAQFITTFARRINDNCHMRCVEAEAGTAVEPGTIYLAKGDHHMVLYQRSTNKIMIRTPVKPEHTFMPSIDITMQSVLQVFGRHTIGVLMTGMGSDGARAMVSIRKAGGLTIAESEESAIVFGMPAEAIQRGGAEIIVPSWEIADQIIKAAGV
ncbi:Protein-glutamate methylesterase/protein-glutamine glutaminase [Desulfonema limicola]|uniref:Protein-glutamate methylesterase/protein-glutamine glutaminase n=1 Tax=Desulfonema limicola TaxID=45656 RepID=A0A975GEB7_9BACT|nr:chemotaxis response regulator protein-glutamate methylesterase [Desulfonema limicola]QTA77940.1 Protein-glutamate methylesterase/protein-glutamine glutaminase [Desulfonema limicola]